jgi:regulation of enolase protein 1 (concanavalin A-like superfamily)
VKIVKHYINNPNTHIMKKLIILTAFLSIGFLAQAQISFDKDLEGGFMDSDESYCVVQTDDGGYVMSGAIWTSDDAGFDIALMKVSETGDKLWVKTYGIGFMNMEIGYGLTKTTDGGFMVCGGTDGFTGSDDDMWIIRTDENGDSLWSRTFGGENQEYAHTVIQTNEGGFLVAGSTNSFGAGFDDVYIVKTDENGMEQWSKTYGTQSGDVAYSVQQTTDGGYIFGGSTNGYSDGYIIKTDVNGDSLWTRTFGGPPTDEFFSIKQTDDGGYVAGGSTMTTGAGNYDFWMVKLGTNGEMEWEKTYGGEEKDKAWSLIQSNDGGYFIAGFTESYAQAEEDEGVFLVKTNANGDTLWTRTYGGAHNDGAHFAIQTIDGGYAVTGYTYVIGEQFNFYLIKTNGDGTVGINDNFDMDKVLGLDIYPNPLHISATIEFSNPENKVYNLTLKNVSGKTLRTLNHITVDKVVIEKRDLPPGVYFVELRGDNLFRDKIIIQ